LRVLIDTMYIAAMLADKKHKKLAEAIDEGKIEAIASVLSLTELVKILGSIDIDDMRTTLRKLKSSSLRMIDVSSAIAEKAGELRLHYEIPTADAIICSTGIVVSAKHVLTDDRHFQATSRLIKPLGIKQLLKMTG
jgi:predicted nucleic acid-binding protein